MATDLSPELLAELYTADPADFLSTRARLAGEAKTSGDVGLARAVTAQRKPTIGAWVVNRQVHQDPSIVTQLLDLGTRLRAAHEALDAGVLRELSTERRQLVVDVTNTALAGADRADAAATLRDDVADSFDAAVADPQIAARLGRLTRGEKWSGFGVVMDPPPSGSPELTVLRGGRGPGGRAASPAKPVRAEPPARVDQAAQRRARRARDKAADALTEAQTALQRSEDAARSTVEQVRDLTARLERVQSELDSAKVDHDRLRQEVRAARSRRREAQSALDRAERRAD